MCAQFLLATKIGGAMAIQKYWVKKPWDLGTCGNQYPTGTVCKNSEMSILKTGVGRCICKLIRGPDSIRFVGITYCCVELLLRSCQFTECHRTMHSRDTHTSLPITRAEGHKRARLKVEEGVSIALEAR